MRLANFYEVGAVPTKSIPQTILDLGINSLPLCSGILLRIVDCLGKFASKAIESEPAVRVFGEENCPLGASWTKRLFVHSRHYTLGGFFYRAVPKDAFNQIWIWRAILFNANNFLGFLGNGFFRRNVNRYRRYRIVHEPPAPNPPISLSGNMNIAKKVEVFSMCAVLPPASEAVCLLVLGRTDGTKARHGAERLDFGWRAFGGLYPCVPQKVAA